ncbi:MAG: hypothetical protein R3A80_01500 [Bdellovibrionota bacterium]
MGLKIFVFLFLSLNLTACFQKSNFGKKQQGLTTNTGGTTGGGTTSGSTTGGTEPPSSGLGISSVSTYPSGNTLSPASTYYPILSGSVASDVERVFIYSSSTCASSSMIGLRDIADNSNGLDASDFENSGAQLDFSTTTKNTLIPIYLKTLKSSGSYSNCYYKASYVHNIDAPIGFAALLSNTSGSSWSTENPPMPSNGDVPKIKLSVSDTEIDNIQLYLGSCSGSPVTGSVTTFTSTGVNLPMNEGLNRVYAKGTGPGSYSSPCREIFRYTLDTTNPTAPGSLSHLFQATSLSGLSFSWTASSDASSGIKKYWYSVGTSAGDTSTKGWTASNDSPSITLSSTNVSISNNVNYYLNIKAEDNAGNMSSVTSSSAWKILSNSSDLLSLEVTSHTNGQKVFSQNVTLSGKCIGRSNANDISLFYPTLSAASGPSSTPCSSATNTFSVGISLLGSAGTKEIRLQQNNGTGTAPNPISLTLNYQPLNQFASLITASENHTCGVKNNHAYCWGKGEKGELGDGDDTDNTTPNLVRSGSLSPTDSFIQVTSGYNHACALSAENLAFCWGDNSNVQLGYSSTSSGASEPSTTDVPYPVTDANGSQWKFKQISAGFYHTCGLSENNNVYCWGRNSYGELGDQAPQTKSKVPYKVSINDGTVVQISAGGLHSCALTSTGEIYCWGYNGNGMLGNNSTADSAIPRNVFRNNNSYLVNNSESFTYVNAGSYQTCAVTNYQNVYCWGYNGNGALGTGDEVNLRIPETIANPSGVKFVKVATNGGFGGNAGYHHSCAISNTGKLYCWGINAHGQLGLGDKTKRLTPREVVMPTGSLATGLLSPLFDLVGQTLTMNPVSDERYIDVTVGGYHTCARSNKENIYCWGAAGNGRLGNGLTTPNTTTPGLVTTYPTP